MDDTLRSRLEAALGSSYTVELEDRRARGYLARDASGKLFVIKIVPEARAAEVNFEIFAREIAPLALLGDAHVVPVLAAGRGADGLLYYVTPFVEGETLRHHVAPGALPTEIAVKILHDVAAALEYAHAHDVDHRDLTMDSVWLSADAAVLTDLGVARALARSTPGESEELDVGADIFAWGVLADELLSGAHAFARHLTSERRVETFFAVLPAARAEANERDAPAALSALVLQTLAKDVQSRPQTAHELVRALEAAWWTSNLVPVPRPKKRSRKGWVYLAGGGVFLIALLALALLRFVFRPQDVTSDDENREIRIGILPLYNDGAPADEYFVDGISEGIRKKLALLPSLEVVGQASMLPYKGNPKGLKAVADEVNARFILIGAVHRDRDSAGSRVKVQTALMDVRSGRVLWKDVSDAANDGVFAFEGKVVERVAHVLRAPVPPTLRTALAGRPTANMAAYDAYLRAEFLSRALAGTRVDSLRAAIAEYNRAVSLDPNFALAWARLSRAHGLVLAFGAVADAEAAGRASERAVAIAPQRWESQWARGMYLDEIARDHKRALAAQLEATRLAPEHPEAWDGLSLAQGYNGNWEEARASAERALVADPRSVMSLQRAADAYMALGDYDEATRKLALAKSIAPMDPHPVFRLMLVRLADVNREGSREEMRESPALKEDINLFVGGKFVPFMFDRALQDRLIALRPEAFVEGRGAWAVTLAQLFSLRGNFVRARAYADSARIAFEGARRDAMNDYRIDRGLAQAYSILNRHDATLAVGARSLGELPNKSDRIEGAWNQYLVARTYVAIGEKEEALRLLEELLAPGNYVKAGWVRLDPAFASLSGNAHFERLTSQFK